jgi:hypothetical protein
MLIPTFKELGKKLGFNVHTPVMAGCPPVFGTYKVYGRANMKSRQRKCKSKIEEWRRYILNTNYDAIVLAARWMTFYESMDELGPQEYLVNYKSSDKSIISSRKLFDRNIKSTIKTILNNGSKVILVSQTPPVNSSTKYCVNIPMYLYRKSDIERRCPVTRYSEAKNYFFNLDYLFKELESRDPNSIYAVIPSKYLCDKKEDFCIIDIDGFPLYKDKSHLSRNGAYYIGESIEKELASFLHFVQ